MFKGSRVSHRKKARRPPSIVVSNRSVSSVSPDQKERRGSISTSTIGPATKKLLSPNTSKIMDDSEIPSFEEFLKDDVPPEHQVIEEEEADCGDVVLYFTPRVPGSSLFGSPQVVSPRPGVPSTGQENGSSRATSTSKSDAPLYSNLPTISLKTTPAPTNILSDFGKTIGKGVRQATQQAKAPLNSLGGQLREVATQVTTSIPLAPPAAPPKKSQLELLLEKSKPKKIYQDVSVSGQPRVIVMYKEAVIMGKDVTAADETTMALEVENAVLIGTPIDNQQETSQKKLQKLFGSFGFNGQRDFDFRSLPRFLRDVPGTNSIKMSEISPTITFPSFETKSSFLDEYADTCYKSVRKERHEVIQGTIWSAVVVEEVESLSQFPPEEVNLTDYLGRTALHYAAGMLDGGQSVSILLGMGADPHVLDDELSTPLHLAAKTGNVLGVHSLLRAGADPNARDLSERTAFFWAAAKSRDSADLSAAEPFIQVMEALVDVGKCDVEVRDTDDRTALHLCVDESGKGARVETLGALLRAPLNLDPSSLRGDLGRTPLHFLCVDKVEDPDSLRIALILLESGARVNACDKRGDTPLHLLLRGDVNQPYPIMIEQRAQLANLLVRYGARLDIPNQSNHTPAEAAKFQRINLEDAIAKWTVRKEPPAVAQMAADPKMIWNLPRAADKFSNANSDMVAPQGIRSVTARLNRAINDNLSMPWQSEAEVSNCYTCRKPFSLLQRKYHCRHCGFVHCAQCTTKYFTMCPPISQPPPAVPVKDRVCDSCFNGMCTNVERTSMALLRLSQDREATKKRIEQENRQALGLKPPSAMDRAEPLKPEESAMSSAARARDALGERGERLESLQQKTAKMREDAANFADMATKLRQQQEVLRCVCKRIPGGARNRRPLEPGLDVSISFCGYPGHTYPKSLQTRNRHYERHWLGRSRERKPVISSSCFLAVTTSRTFSTSIFNIGLASSTSNSNVTSIAFPLEPKDLIFDVSVGGLIRP